MHMYTVYICICLNILKIKCYMKYMLHICNYMNLCIYYYINIY